MQIREDFKTSVVTIPQKKLQVAMLEDDSDDRYLTNEVIEALGFDLHISFYANSVELFDALEKTSPQLLLIDYNSTPENGLEVLKKLKKFEEYRTLPVVILSDSSDPKLRKRCYSEGVSAFVVKPSSLAQTQEKIKSFFTFWIEVAEL